MKIKQFKSSKDISSRLDKRGDHGYSADPVSLRIMAFIAEQLEIMNRPKKKRPLSAWQKFFASQVKAGRSPKEAAAAWKAKKAR